MERLCQLQDLPVFAEDGGRLGHVFEIRSPGRAETEPTYRWRGVDTLLCGRAGLLERLGWRKRNPRQVPWDAVVAVEAQCVRVRGTASDYEEMAR